MNIVEIKQREKMQGQIDASTALEIELVYLPAIMRKQTYDEVDAGKTCRRNGIGLSKVHTQFITSLYTQTLNGAHLTDKQVCVARKILRHYWKQFLNPNNKHDSQNRTLSDY